MEKEDREAGMISFDFNYYRPTTIGEAVNTFQQLKGIGKTAVYYAGGTEIICLARLDQMVFDAVIDIKEIPECNVLEFCGEKLVIGAAVTLTKLSDAKLFSLLGEVCKATADHTARDMITVGGNICGKTPYRETVLPFLIAESEAVIAGKEGTRTVCINDIFDQSLQLADGEFLVQLLTDKSCVALPYVSRKRTKHGGMDYPLYTAAAFVKDNRIRLALSGICAYPFRSKTVEDALSDIGVPAANRIDHAVSHLPGPILDDIQGSAEYREYLLRNMLSDILSTLGGGL
jgi:xanthine dehydrogenase molybdenum-binding subunit